jgi:hypothetical protein
LNALGAIRFIGAVIRLIGVTNSLMPASAPTPSRAHHEATQPQPFVAVV